MKKASIMTLILVLTATLFAGCRNMGGNTTTPTSPSLPKPTVAPTSSATQPSSSTTPGGASTPSTPNSTDATNPGGSGIEGRGMRPSARGPRY